jgi:hypothetical protein
LLNMRARAQQRGTAAVPCVKRYKGRRLPQVQFHKFILCSQRRAHKPFSSSSCLASSSIHCLTNREAQGRASTANRYVFAAVPTPLQLIKQVLLHSVCFQRSCSPSARQSAALLAEQRSSPARLCRAMTQIAVCASANCCCVCSSMCSAPLLFELLALAPSELTGTACHCWCASLTACTASCSRQTALTACSIAYTA